MRRAQHRASGREVLVKWGRIGLLGFGGPPAHIAMLRDLCVDRRRWIDHDEFEDSVAATGLLPGPSSTQLAILTAWRVRGAAGALIGGAAFILPGLVAVLALSVLFLADAPPEWVIGAGAGAGAAIAPVALQAAAKLAPPSWSRARESHPGHWAIYAGLGFAATVLVGPWLVAVLLACGAYEAWRRRRAGAIALGPLAGVALVAAISGGAGALAWVAFKVGALSYGGGFVIVPLMQADAVEVYGWMTDSEFLNAVALGQATPGPVVQTVAAVGYAAGGIWAGLLAAAIAFAPSFTVVLVGADRFDRLRGNPDARAFLDGAGPAAVGAIGGAAIPLALALSELWQWMLLAAAALGLLVLGRGVVAVLLASAAAGVGLALAGASLP